MKVSKDLGLESTIRPRGRAKKRGGNWKKVACPLLETPFRGERIY